ncbi:hypothetical protein QBC40DRAFT_283231 [Triangularia verruculosa]|uniref:VOC domain-containing protein n=1 Tax=Triangularia verruculosa TaxID=2587418 RepID=A0AAN7ATG5_9PEZI|nr:hypothetical protein QBC40DRAFT_283231 [Triangularia verruculosa]
MMFLVGVCIRVRRFAGSPFRYNSDHHQPEKSSISLSPENPEFNLSKMSSETAVNNPPSFFVNLPTSDLKKATAFFVALDFDHIKLWSDDKSSAFRLPGANSQVSLMIHVHDRFKTFNRPNTSIVNAFNSTEALFSFMAKDKVGVDAFIQKAVDAGGKADPYMLENFGQAVGMYNRSFEDLDGHIWEVCSMISPCAGVSPVGDDDVEV